MVLTGCILLYTVLGSATVTLEAATGNTTIQPGTTETAANYTLHVQNDSAALTDIYVNQFPFDTAFSPANTTVTAGCTGSGNNTPCTVQNRTITADVTVPDGWTAGDFTGTAVFVFQNRSAITRPITVEVPEVRNWTVRSASFHETVNLGSDGDLGNLTVGNTGNVPIDLGVNATGNITQLYDDLPATISTNPGRNRTVTIQYQLPADTPFGHYSGNLTLTGPDNTSAVVPVAVWAEDTTPPQFNQPLAMDDIMATTDRSVALVLKDNLDVAEANVTVLRETTFQQRNQTFRTNETVTSYDLERRSEFSDIWEFTYDATEERGQYWLNMTVQDTAGNTVWQVDGFEVTTLDAVEVLDSNLRLDGIRFDSKGSVSIIQNRVESPFTVRLQSFTYSGNETPQVGLLGPGDDSPEVFDDDREAVSFSETGTYQLVIEPQGRETQSDSYSFDGRLGIEVPRQHANISNITFGGSIDSERYQPGEFISIGEFDGYIGYDNALTKFEDRYGDIGVGPSKEFVYYIGKMNASQCAGADNWFDCSSLTLGEYERMEDRAETAENKLQGIRLQLWIERILLLFGLYAGWRFYKYRKLLRLYLPRKYGSNV